MSTGMTLGYYLSTSSNPSDSEQNQKCYVYGLIYQNDVDWFQEKLTPHKIELVVKGCIMGGEEYRNDMRMNKQIYDSATEEVKELLDKPRVEI